MASYFILFLLLPEALHTVAIICISSRGFFSGRFFIRSVAHVVQPFVWATASLYGRITYRLIDCHSPSKSNKKRTKPCTAGAYRCTWLIDARQTNALIRECSSYEICIQITELLCKHDDIFCRNITLESSLVQQLIVFLIQVVSY